MKSFNQTINYSSSNEDSWSEITSLDIKSSDTVLCITGSGGRSLDLLIKEPKEIISIDANPIQNYLLELKFTAIKHLDYEPYLEFLGIRKCNNRKSTYKILRPYLSPMAREFWDQNLRKIANGVMYQGRWEKYFRLLSLVLRLIRPRLLSLLFGNIQLSEQKEIWREEWDNRLWRNFLKTIGVRFVWKYFLRDPGFYQYVPTDFSTSGYLIYKFNQAVQFVDFSKSYFATLLFWGKLDEAKCLPPHLQKVYFPILKSNVSRIKIISESLGDYLSKCKPNSFDKYSLSDFSSYTDEDEYNKIWNGILSTARRNALACERQFLVKRDIPSHLKSIFKRNQELETKLDREDSSIFYTFITGKICQAN